MQVQKDVLIAGGVVVVCVALVVVALVATGKHDKGAAVADNGGMMANPGSDMQGPEADSGYANGGAPFGGYGQSPNNGGFAGSPLAPLPPVPQPAPQPGSDLGGTAFTPGGNSPPMVLPPPAPVPPAPGPGGAPVAAGGQGATTHVVAKGETLSDISQAHYGTSKHWRRIVEANPGLDPVRLKLGQVIQIPVIDDAAPAGGAGGATADGTYTVERGDSYYSIAKKQLGSPGRWREIERLNNVPAEDLKPGTVLKLPAKDTGTSAPGAPGAPAAAGGRTHIVAKGETLGDISKQYFGTTTKWRAIVEANPGVKAENLKVGQSLSIPDLPAAPAAAEPGAAGGYTVKAGDTLESIAAALLGKKSAWKEIAEANPGLKPSSLRVGQRIVIPGASSAAPAPSPDFGRPTPAPGPGFGAPAPAPAPTPTPAPAPAPSDDLFFSPYDNKPAPAPAAPGGPVSLRAPAAANQA